jgi:hypothetical protein
VVLPTEVNIDIAGHLTATSEWAMDDLRSLWETCREMCLVWPLMVNFRQPSHEFTFGVGMNFISYPMVLTPLEQVCSCMSVLEFDVYAKI